MTGRPTVEDLAFCKWIGLGVFDAVVTDVARAAVEITLARLNLVLLLRAVYEKKKEDLFDWELPSSDPAADLKAIQDFMSRSDRRCHHVRTPEVNDEPRD